MTILDPGVVDTPGLLKLMCWLSPAFPVGGFSYSHGIETAVETGLVSDRRSAEAWIGWILGHGSVWQDAGAFLAAHRAIDLDGDLSSVVEWAQALRGTAEMALESKAQGAAFLTAVSSAWPSEELERWTASLSPAPPYAVAVAVVAAVGGVGEAAALGAYLQAAASSLVSAAVRLVPLGQTDGQRAVAHMASIIPELVARARRLPLEQFGTAAPMVDWTSMTHETQHTRLFRS